MGTDCEYLVVSGKREITQNATVSLSDLPPMDLVLPSPENVRRRKIDQYLTTNGIKMGRIMELDSMFATLDLVENSNWATILPGIICLPDKNTKQRQIKRLKSPSLEVEYLRIEPSSVPLSDIGQAFYGFLMDELLNSLEALQ